MDNRVTERQLKEYRAVERRTWQAIAAEFQAMGYNVEADQLRWASEEFRRRMLRAKITRTEAEAHE